MNRYIEKLAGSKIHDVTHLGRGARELIGENPVTAVGGTVGAIDGGTNSMSKREHETKYQKVSRVAHDTVSGMAGGLVTGKGVEYGMKKIHQRAHANKYIHKVASLKGALRELSEIPAATKASLAISSAGLGTGAANLHANREKNRVDASKKNIEERSLKALQGIHKTLVNNQ